MISLDDLERCAPEKIHKPESGHIYSLYTNMKFPFFNSWDNVDDLYDKLSQFNTAQKDNYDGKVFQLVEFLYGPLFFNDTFRSSNPNTIDSLLTYIEKFSDFHYGNNLSRTKFLSENSKFLDDVSLYIPIQFTGFFSHVNSYQLKYDDELEILISQLSNDVYKQNDIIRYQFDEFRKLPYYETIKTDIKLQEYLTKKLTDIINLSDDDKKEFKAVLQTLIKLVHSPSTAVKILFVLDSI